MVSKVYEDDKIVVHGKWKDGSFEIYVHPKRDGVEMLPRGYMLGSNALAYTPIKGA